MLIRSINITVSHGLVNWHAIVIIWYAYVRCTLTYLGKQAILCIQLSTWKVEVRPFTHLQFFI